MGKKKGGDYNDFLDGEKLTDNKEIRTSLNGSSSAARDISPPPMHQRSKSGNEPNKTTSGTKRPLLTHFLCLPLVTDTSRPQLEDGLANLQRQLTTDNLIPTKAVRPTGSLHLTLGVMSLTCTTRLEEAKQLLQSINLHSLLRDITTKDFAEQAARDGTIAENLNAAALPDTDSLTVDLCALAPMQTPIKTSILYANPKDATGRLLPFATQLRDKFVQAGFVVDEGRALKLHATIINTVYAKSKQKNGNAGRSGRHSGVKDTLKHIEHKVSLHRHHGDEEKRHSDQDSHDHDGAVQDKSSKDEATSQGHGPDAKSWLKFDARNLIEQYADFTWAKNVRIDSVQICKMGAKKIWSGEGEAKGVVVDEEYEVVYEEMI